MSPLLQVRHLVTQIMSNNRLSTVVNGVDFTVDAGETLAIVGESGCGKSMTALSLLRLLPPGGKITDGAIEFEGQDLLRLNEHEMRRIRGNRISMIFQEPMTSLNPVMTIGAQIEEGLRLHRGLSRQDAVDESITLLQQVGIPSPGHRRREYPHQLSGGMRQRVMIAISLACRPQLLIADEPTTALDVTIQAQILELLDQVKSSLGMGMILISHDMGVVAEHAQRTAIMYAGGFVETAPTAELFANPLHPYTKGLLRSLPQNSTPGTLLSTIPGQVPSLDSPVAGCGFCDRCQEAMPYCKQAPPPARDMGNNHFVSCWKLS